VRWEHMGHGFKGGVKAECRKFMYCVNASQVARLFCEKHRIGE